MIFFNCGRPQFKYVWIPISSRICAYTAKPTSVRVAEGSFGAVFPKLCSITLMSFTTLTGLIK